MYSCKKPSEAIKKVWFTLKYLLNSAIGGNKLWKFPVIVKLNLKKGLDKKKWEICICSKPEKLFTTRTHHAGVNTWCVWGGWGGGFSNGNAGWHAVLPLVTAADQTETGRYWSVKVKFDVTSSLWHARDSFIKIIFPYIDNKSKYKQGNPTVEAIYLYCN